MDIFVRNWFHSDMNKNKYFAETFDGIKIKNAKVDVQNNMYGFFIFSRVRQQTINGFITYSTENASRDSRD